MNIDATGRTNIEVTAIGGPTARIRIGDVVLLTDPTFDAAGQTYASGAVTLEKTGGPALATADVGPVDVVLLSHDQHADNLDRAGRAFLGGVPRVLTTVAGAGRLSASHVQGLAPWESVDLGHGDGALRVTATPARHGPAGIEPLTGDVIGFVVSHVASGRDGASPRDLLYVTGDTCWFDGVAEVARRFAPEVVLLFAGAAMTRGPFHLTMDTNDALELAAHFPGATLVPLHHDGWRHFTQSAADLLRAFRAVGQESRLRLLEPGAPAVFGQSGPAPLR